MKRKGSAVWTGGLKDGSGTVSTASGVLQDTPYGFQSRFESGAGTNPEELIAAAHAGCFSMAFALMLGNAGLRPERIATTAEVSLDKVGEGFDITAVHLRVAARIPGAERGRFEELAQQAKDGCPVSKLMKARITMDAELEA